MEWLYPWWPTDDCDRSFHETFERQLRIEICPDDPIYAIPAKVIGRGNGDDALFELLNGSGRVAFGQLKWGSGQETGQFRTQSCVYTSIDAFYEKHMLPEHEELTKDE